MGNSLDEFSFFDSIPSSNFILVRSKGFYVDSCYDKRMDILEENGTWELVSLHTGNETVGADGCLLLNTKHIELERDTV